MKIVFILFFCGLNACSFAAILPAALPDDSSTLKKPYELNLAEFLARYGRDDSSRALINLFFHKRGIGVPNTVIGIPLIVAGGIGLGVVNHKTNNGAASWDLIGQALLFTMILGAGIALLSIGITFCGKYSRKKLMKLLNNYFAGKQLPVGITKNKAFRNLVIARH